MRALKAIWHFIEQKHNLIASLCVIPFQIATFAVYVYRGGQVTPLAYTTKFNGFLFVALTLLAAFFTTFAVARLAVGRQTARITRLGINGASNFALNAECEEAACGINAGIGLCGIATWTILLTLCFVALDLPGWMLFPFSMLYIAGLFTCTGGVRTLNRMLNLELREELKDSCVTTLREKGFSASLAPTPTIEHMKPMHVVEPAQR